MVSCFYWPRQDVAQLDAARRTHVRSLTRSRSTHRRHASSTAFNPTSATCRAASRARAVFTEQEVRTAALSPKSAAGSYSSSQHPTSRYMRVAATHQHSGSKATLRPMCGCETRYRCTAGSVCFSDGVRSHGGCSACVRTISCSRRHGSEGGTPCQDALSA